MIPVRKTIRVSTLLAGVFHFWTVVQEWINAATAAAKNRVKARAAEFRVGRRRISNAEADYRSLR